jgi:hypothetical protein
MGSRVRTAGGRRRKVTDAIARRDREPRSSAQRTGALSRVSSRRQRRRACAQRREIIRVLNLRQKIDPPRTPKGGAPQPIVRGRSAAAPGLTERPRRPPSRRGSLRQAQRRPDSAGLTRTLWSTLATARFAKHDRDWPDARTPAAATPTAKTACSVGRALLLQGETCGAFNVNLKLSRSPSAAGRELTAPQGHHGAAPVPPWL